MLRACGSSQCLCPSCSPSTVSAGLIWSGQNPVCTCMACGIAKNRCRGESERATKELFTKIMAVIANLSFNFNFFQPDCSVESPYWQTWIMPHGFSLWGWHFAERHLPQICAPHEVHYHALRPDGSHHVLIPGCEIPFLPRKPWRPAISSSSADHQAADPKVQTVTALGQRAWTMSLQPITP